MYINNTKLILVEYYVIQKKETKNKKINVKYSVFSWNTHII